MDHVFFWRTQVFSTHYALLSYRLHWAPERKLLFYIKTITTFERVIRVFSVVCNLFTTTLYQILEYALQFSDSQQLLFTIKLISVTIMNARQTNRGSIPKYVEWLVCFPAWPKPMNRCLKYFPHIKQQQLMCRYFRIFYFNDDYFTDCLGDANIWNEEIDIICI